MIRKIPLHAFLKRFGYICPCDKKVRFKFFFRFFYFVISTMRFYPLGYVA